MPANLGCFGTARCPRCSGCGYPDCPDCVDDRAKRAGCWRCGGAGIVPCEVDHTPDEGISPPHGTRVPTNGEKCPFCDQPTPPGDGGCESCWTSIPDNLADLKALFADNDLSIEQHREGR